jgi:alpha-galactosidase
MCLSGDIHELNAGQWACVEEAVSFYRDAVSIIKRGTTHRFGTPIASYRHPEGWQGIVRLSEDRSEVLIVVHTFAGALPDRIEVPLPEAERYELRRVFSDGSLLPNLTAVGAEFEPKANFAAVCALLKR